MSQCYNAQSCVFCLQNDASAGFQRGTSGNYIVYQQEVFAFYFGPVSDGKTFTYILPPLSSLFSGLCFSWIAPQDIACDNGNVQHRRYAPADQRCLVVTTFAFFVGVKRQRNQSINSVEPSAFEKALPGKCAEVFADGGIAFVFKPVYKLLYKCRL